MSPPPPPTRSVTTYLVPKTTLSRPPSHPINSSITTTISSLQLHPTLEATLHILNADLASAHFLVRHMSGPPAIEGMLLHYILHRTEGEFQNARAWTSDVRIAVEGGVPKHRGEKRLDDKIIAEMQGGEDGEVSFLRFVYGEGEAKGMKLLIDDVERLRKEGWKRNENERQER